MSHHNAMTSRSPLYCIQTVHHAATAQVLREYADKAERGEIIGVALTAVDVKMRSVCDVVGYLYHRPREAYFAVSLLRESILDMERAGREV